MSRHSTVNYLLESLIPSSGKEMIKKKLYEQIKPKKQQETMIKQIPTLFHTAMAAKQLLSLMTYRCNF